MRSAAEVIRAETAINTAVTAVIAGLITWLIHHGRESIPLFGLPAGGLFGILPGTFNFTLFVTVVLTLVIRARVRRGACASLSRDLKSTRLLPPNLLLRGLLLAFVMTVILVPAGYGIAWMTTGTGDVSPAWRLPGLTVFYVVYFVMLSLVVTPLVVARALQDQA